MSVWSTRKVRIPTHTPSHDQRLVLATDTFWRQPGVRLEMANANAGAQEIRLEVSEVESLRDWLSAWLEERA